MKMTNETIFLTYLYSEICSASFILFDELKDLNIRCFTNFMYEFYKPDVNCFYKNKLDRIYNILLRALGDQVSYA